MHLFLAVFLFAFINFYEAILLPRKEPLKLKPVKRNYHDLNYNFDDLPKSFDWRNVNGKSYVTIERNQHLPQWCGSCWSHGPTSAIADRIYIQHNASLIPQPMLSVQTVINCNKYHSGCGGGKEEHTYEYAMEFGIPHETCKPYQAENQKCNKKHKCFDCTKEECHPIKEYQVYKIKNYTLLESGNVNAIKAEIFHHGPISCGMDALTGDFWHTYKGGIATGPFNNSNHAVEIVGWGLENREKYWIGRNSWEGWFRMTTKQGENRGIDKHCIFVDIDKHSIVDVKED